MVQCAVLSATMGTIKERASTSRGTISRGTKVFSMDPASIVPDRPPLRGDSGPSTSRRAAGGAKVCVCPGTECVGQVCATVFRNKIQSANCLNSILITWALNEASVEQLGHIKSTLQAYNVRNFGEDDEKVFLSRWKRDILSAVRLTSNSVPKINSMKNVEACMSVSYISELLSAIYDSRNAYVESERIQLARAQSLSTELDNLKSEARCFGALRETNNKLALDLKTASDRVEQLEREMREARQSHAEALEEAEARHECKLNTYKAHLNAMDSQRSLATDAAGKLQGQLMASELKCEELKNFLKQAIEKNKTLTDDLATTRSELDTIG